MREQEKKEKLQLKAEIIIALYYGTNNTNVWYCGINYVIQNCITFVNT